MNDPRLQLAADAVERGNGERALEHLSEVSDLEDPNVWRLRASAFSATGAFRNAETSCRRGLAIDPGHIGLQLALSDCLESQEKASEAEAVLISLLNQQPELHPALVRYAWLLARAGDAEGARSVMAHLPASSLSGMPAMLALQGYVAMIEGRRREAKEFLDRGLALAPEDSSMRLLAALEASLDDRASESADHVLAAAALDPEAVGEHGRWARYMDHPLMAPSRLINRVGPGRLWIGWIVVVFGLPQVWAGAPMGWIIAVYLLFAVYSWTVPFLLRRWMMWRGHL